MKKKFDLRVFTHPILKKLIMKLKIAILVIVVGISNAIAMPAEGSGSELQQNQVTGTVTDANGNPLPGVTVVVKGTTAGALTDIDGKYSIVSLPQNAILVYSFIGMATQEIPLNGQTKLDVVLSEEAIGLDEVVVIGYGTQKRVNVIGSVTTMVSEEISKAPVSVISNAIAGRMPGAIVQQSLGEPGNDASTILIRGKATLGNNSPLIVVDGVPDRDMNSLQPSDIESITILKDASAAIYGARSANGVILITTKRGKEDSPTTINYGYYRGWQSPTDLTEMVDAQTYAQMIREMQSYRNVAESNMMFSLEDIEKYKSGEYPWTHPNTDWYAEGLKKNSMSANHNLSLNGGTQSLAYYGSFGSQFNDGIYQNDNAASKYQRYNLKGNVNARLNKYLSVGLDMAGSMENSIFPVNGQGGIFAMLHRSRPTMPAFWPNGYPGPDLELGRNPAVISGFEPGSDENKTYRLNSQLSASLNVPGVEGLTLSGYYSFDKYFKVQKKFEKPYTLYSLDEQAYLNAGNTGKEDGSAFLIPMFPKGDAPEPRLNDTYEDSETKFFNVKLNYDKTLGGVHNLSTFVSMESSDYLSKSINAFRRYFISDKIPYLFAGGTTSMSNDGDVNIDARLNYFGRLMYNFKETYLFQFSLRRDGSLRFSKESGRWGTFPSVLAGWRISNEDFWKNNIKVIDYFKLKASFGQMGNDLVSPFQYLSSYELVDGMIRDDSKILSAGLRQSGAPNPSITWEVANIFNAGFESALLNSRLTLNADFFYQRRSKILVKRNASVPNFTGISLPDENFGIVDNKGFELELGYHDRKGNFSYDIMSNFAFARNSIVEFDEPVRNVEWQVLTGHPQGSTLLYRSLGIFRDDEQVASMPHVSGARPGDVILEDYDKNGIINADDRVLFDKTADPEITYGANLNLRYKNWALTCLIQGVGSNLRNSQGGSQSGTSGNYYLFDAVDRWTVDNIDATNPRAFERQEEYWRDTYQSDYKYRKSGYGRLKNIQLSYSVPKRFLDAVMLREATVYCSGENLLLLYSQNDIMYPEKTSLDSYPIMKVFVTGIKVTF